MPFIQYKNDKTGVFNEAGGSSKRLNVSSRSDSRGYYNSRDEGQAYTLCFEDADAAEEDFFVYWQNTSATQDLVISSAHVGSSVAGGFKFHLVSGTASGGSPLTPTNENKTSSNAATTSANCLGNGALSGLTSSGCIDITTVPANGHEEFQLDDRVRLGQNDAIAIQFSRTTAGNTIAEGSISGFYEEK